MGVRPVRVTRCGQVAAPEWLHLIWIKASDTNGEPRKIVTRRYLSDRRGHIAPDDFDPCTGVFQMSVHKI